MDRRQARVLNFYNTAEDFWPARQWPAWILKWMLNGHLRGNAMRYKVFCFFNFNGMDPNEIVKLMITYDVDRVRGRIPPPFADRQDKVMRHLMQMRKQAYAGTLLGDAPMMDMVAGFAHRPSEIVKPSYERK